MLKHSTVDDCFRALAEPTRRAIVEKVGRVRTYRLEPSGFTPLADWVAARRALMERRFDRLGEILAEPDPQPIKRSRRRVKDTDR
jgi:hypothetical protein